MQQESHTLSATVWYKSFLVTRVKKHTLQRAWHPAKAKVNHSVSVSVYDLKLEHTCSLIHSTYKACHARINPDIFHPWASCVFISPINSFFKTTWHPLYPFSSLDWLSLVFKKSSCAYLAWHYSFPLALCAWESMCDIWQVSECQK